MYKLMKNAFICEKITKMSEAFSPIGFLFSNRTIDFCPSTNWTLPGVKEEETNKQSSACFHPPENIK